MTTVTPEELVVQIRWVVNNQGANGSFHELAKLLVDGAAACGAPARYPFLMDAVTELKKAQKRDDCSDGVRDRLQGMVDLLEVQAMRAS